MDMKEKAEHFYNFFEVATRKNGEQFYRTKDCAPDYVTEMCFVAHGDMLPDDYRYKWINRALELFATGGTDENINEYADSLIDVYYSALDNWQSSNIERHERISEAMRETQHDSLESAQQWAQHSEVCETLYSVWCFLEDWEETQDAA